MYVALEQEGSLANVGYERKLEGCMSRTELIESEPLRKLVRDGSCQRSRPTLSIVYIVESLWPVDMLQDYCQPDGRIRAKPCSADLLLRAFYHSRSDKSHATFTLWNRKGVVQDHFRISLHILANVAFPALPSFGLPINPVIHCPTSAIFTRSVPVSHPKLCNR